MQDPKTLRALFLADLDTDARKNAWDAKGRVLWIMDHLDEYIERWLGFASLRISPQALIQSDLFTVVDVAIEVLEQEFEGNGASFEERHLRKIREAVEALRKHGNAEYAVAIKDLVGELRSHSPVLGA
jgi:hypothetical protein